MKYSAKERNKQTLLTRYKTYWDHQILLPLILLKQVARAENSVYTYKLWRDLNLDHSGVGWMDELLPKRCMVTPNEVEETEVWTGYNNISSKHYSNNWISVMFYCLHMMANVCHTAFLYIWGSGVFIENLFFFTLVQMYNWIISLHQELINIWINLWIFKQGFI